MAASVPCQPPALGRAGKPTFLFQTSVGVLWPRDASLFFLTCFSSLYFDLTLNCSSCLLSCLNFLNLADLLYSLNLLSDCFSDLMDFLDCTYLQNLLLAMNLDLAMMSSTLLTLWTSLRLILVTMTQLTFLTLLLLLNSSLTSLLSLLLL